MNASSAYGATNKARISSVIPAFLAAVPVLATAFALPVGAAADFKTVSPLPASILTGYSTAQTFRSPSALFVDRKRGDIWVADSGNRRIVGFDPQGAPHLQFTHRSVDPDTGEAAPAEPVSVAVDSTGQVFVTDGASDRIAMYDYRGRLIKRVALARLLGVERACPRWLRVDRNDNLYVADVDVLRLVVLNRDQELVRVVDLKRPAGVGSGAQGSGGEKEQPFQVISAMDVGSDGKIYLLNSTDYPCVRVLDPTGKELIAFGDIDAGRDNFVRPVAIVSIDDGTFWVADAGLNIVKQFAGDGKYQQYIGGGPGTRPGEMRVPVALATDGSERLCVAERGTHRVQVFSLR